MFIRIVFIIITVDWVTTIQLSKRPFEFELHKLNCLKHDILLKQYECSMVKLANSHYNMGLMFELSKDMPRNVDFGLVIYVKPRQGDKYIKFMDTKVNMCNLVEHAMTVPMIKYLMERVTRNSNLPISCPIRGGYVYNITNVEIASDFFPSYTPVIEFNFSLNWLDNKKQYSTYIIEGETKRKS